MLVVAILMIWIIYSIIVVIYLNLLTRKYLVPVNRDDLIGDKVLKSHQDMMNEYRNRESINVLVLSGGGVRGLAPLYSLIALETITGKKTGELFDFIAGTSVGAISAAVFAVGDDKGAYKYSARELEKSYYNNIYRMFRSTRIHKILTLFGIFAPKYLPENKMEVLHEYFGDMAISELKGNILVPVYNIDSNDLQIVRNWEAIHGAGNDNYLIKDLINGASSPPMIFPPLAFELYKKPHLFIDSAVLLNNPVLYVLLYLKALFPDKHINIVAVGNGGTNEATYDYRHMFSFGLYGLYQYLFSAPSLGAKLSIEMVENIMQEAKDKENTFSFYRINSKPAEGLSSTNPSIKNLHRIRRFGRKMAQDNMDLINKIAKIVEKK